MPNPINKQIKTVALQKNNYGDRYNKGRFFNMYKRRFQWQQSLHDTGLSCVLTYQAVCCVETTSTAFIFSPTKNMIISMLIKQRARMYFSISDYFMMAAYESTGSSADPATMSPSHLSPRV